MDFSLLSKWQGNAKKVSKSRVAAFLFKEKAGKKPKKASQSQATAFLSKKRRHAKGAKSEQSRATQKMSVVSHKKALNLKWA